MVTTAWVGHGQNGNKAMVYGTYFSGAAFVAFLSSPVGGQEWKVEFPWYTVFAWSPLIYIPTERERERLVKKKNRSPCHKYK